LTTDKTFGPDFIWINLRFLADGRLFSQQECEV